VNSREGSSIGSVATGHVLKGWIFNDTIPATRAAPQGGQAAIAAMQPSPKRDGVARALAKFARTPSIDFASTGKSPKRLSSPLCKNILVHF
jgi:hypothetical protein